MMRERGMGPEFFEQGSEGPWREPEWNGPQGRFRGAQGAYGQGFSRERYEGRGYPGPSRGMRDGGREQQRGPRGDGVEDEAPLVKVIEVVAQSPRGWEDAAERALAEAARSVRNIRSIYVKDMQAIVADGCIVQYRLVAKISFALEGGSERNGRMARQYD